MTTGWLLLLVVVISSQSVDSQSTDKAVCDGEDDNMCDEKQCFEMKRYIQILQMENAAMKSDIQTLLDNRQQHQSLFQTYIPAASAKPRDCYEILNSGEHEHSDGVYTVHIGRAQSPVLVYCDMTTAGGGWTVFQRRKDGSVDFNRDWTDYSTGFGNLTGEFWLGNDNLHLLTYSDTRQRLRVDLADFEGNTRYAEYDDFTTGPAMIQYRLLSLGEYNGTANDCLAYHLGQRFSTRDQDNDAWQDVSCAAVKAKGAWWYRHCHDSNLNGLYYDSGNYTSDYDDGVVWGFWKGWWYSLRFTEMKLRPFDVRIE